uniref:Transposase n=1 Tax=Ascaris lumbricoides TaxID=6252 RepID=A0A0M3IA02_ASCLU
MPRFGSVHPKLRGLPERLPTPESYDALEFKTFLKFRGYFTRLLKFQVPRANVICFAVIQDTQNTSTHSLSADA